MNRHFIRRTIIFLLVIVLFLAGTVNATAVHVGELAEEWCETGDPAPDTLFNLLLDYMYRFGNVECNDWDMLDALALWKPYENVELVSYEDNSDSTQYSEKYSFKVDVNDAVVSYSLTVSFDLWVTKVDECGEYYTCTIDTISKKVVLSQAKWVTGNTKNYYYESDPRPDGTLAINGHFKTGDEWVDNYQSVSLKPIADEWKNYPYGYDISFNDAWKAILYPDGTIYDRWFKVYCYPEGVEKQVKEIEASYGNEIGNTSSNFFNGCRMAMEGDVLVTYSGGTIYRQLKNGENKMGIYSNDNTAGFACVNLLDGECWFVRESEGAYGVTLDGRLDYLVRAKAASMMVDRDGVFFTICYSGYGYKEGIYRFDTRAGTEQLIYSDEARNIGIYGDWIYFNTLHGDYIYRVRKSGGEAERVSVSKTIGPFIVQDGLLLYYTSRDENLCYRRIEADGTLGDETIIANHAEFGGSSAYVGSDNTKRVALDHGWIYYYYNRDNSMICRRSLDGSIIDDFVCYSSGYTSGIYIFGKEMYLANRSGDAFLATELDDTYAPDYIVPMLDSSQSNNSNTPTEELFTTLAGLSEAEAVNFVAGLSEKHENLWQMVNDAYHEMNSDADAIYRDYNISIMVDEDYYIISTFDNNNTTKCVFVIGQFSDSETVNGYASERNAANGQPDEDGWCTDTYACGRSLVTLMYKYSGLFGLVDDSTNESNDQDLYFEETDPGELISDKYAYTLLDDGTAEITRFTGDDAILAIPAVVDGHEISRIGNEAFALCPSLTDITIPDSVTSIGDSAFLLCTNLMEISIPDSVTSIGEYAFANCNSLKDITLPNNITSIGNGAFLGCEMTDIIIPNSVTSIEGNPFALCEIINIIVSPDHPTLATIDGVLFSKMDRRLICYPHTFSSSEYSIPQGIKSIGDYAFADCISLKVITIPDSVTNIGSYSFNGCDRLKGITIPDGVTSIGNGAFERCADLSSITIPDGVTNIRESTFSSCTSLTKVILPDSITSIGDMAFFCCTGLTDISIPNSVTSIGLDALCCSESLTVTVGHDSYAMQYCIDNDINYTYDDPIAEYSDVTGTDTGRYRVQCMENSAVNRIDTEEMDLVNYSASSELTTNNKTFPVSNCFDGKLDTAWAEGESGDGIGSSVSASWQVYFGEWWATGLSIWSGNQKNSDRYYMNNRPRDITIEIWGGEYEKEYHCYNVELSDYQGRQDVYFEDWIPMSDITDLKITINSVYNGDKYDYTCISELDLILMPTTDMNVNEEIENDSIDTETILGIFSRGLINELERGNDFGISFYDVYPNFEFISSGGPGTSTVGTENWTLAQRFVTADGDFYRVANCDEWISARTEANTKADVLQRFRLGEIVWVIGTWREWSLCVCPAFTEDNYVCGWALSRYLVYVGNEYQDEYNGSHEHEMEYDDYYPTQQYVFASDGDTNVRTGPGLEFVREGVITKGDGANYLGVSSIDDRGVIWYKIDYYGTGAWVSSRYTTLLDGYWSGSGSSNYNTSTETSYVEGTSGKSNVRTGPGLSYSDVGVLHKGETATFLNETSTDDRGVIWYKISWNGEINWVSSKYTTLY